MTISITAKEYYQFSKQLEQESGIVLGENKQYLVANRLSGICQELGITSLGELLEIINKNSIPSLNARIIQAMTTNETLWFRDQYPYEFLKRIILPEIVRSRPGSVRIWSAACSSGQEPYSISMIFEEYRHDYPKGKYVNIQIMATDISSAILEHAKEGKYSEIALSRGLSDDRREKYFTAHDDKMIVNENIRNQVVFRQLNLKDSYTSLGKFHVIFCRNVLIYFAPDLKSDILERMARSLEPGGYLFLGGSESIAHYTNKFENARSFNGMAFRLKGSQ